MYIFFTLCKIQEYSEDSNSEPNVDLENQYYNSKALKEDDPKAALSSFQKVYSLIFHIGTHTSVKYFALLEFISVIDWCRQNPVVE